MTADKDHADSMLIVNARGWAGDKSADETIEAAQRELHLGRHYVTDLCAALAAHQWQPIETAPRDGTDVRLFGRLFGTYGYTDDEMVESRGRFNTVTREWARTVPTARYDQGFTPTHWMIISAPPETTP